MLKRKNPSNKNSGEEALQIGDKVIYQTLLLQEDPSVGTLQYMGKVVLILEDTNQVVVSNSEAGRLVINSEDILQKL